MCFQAITMPTPPPSQNFWGAPRVLIPANSAPPVPLFPRGKPSISVAAASASFVVLFVIVAAASGIGMLKSWLPNLQPELPPVAVTSATPVMPASPHRALMAPSSISCPTLSPGLGTRSASLTMLSPELYVPGCTFWAFDELSGVNTPWQGAGNAGYGRRFFGANPDFQIGSLGEGRAYAAPLTAGQIQFLAIK
jgi:hypothetical protein